MKKVLILLSLLSLSAFSAETITLDCNINSAEEIGASTKHKESLESNYQITLKRKNLIAPFSEVSFSSAGKGEVIVQKSLLLNKRTITFAKEVERAGQEAGARLHFKLFRNGNSNTDFKLRVSQRHKSSMVSPFVDTFKNNGANYKCDARLLVE